GHVAGGAAGAAHRERPPPGAGVPLQGPAGDRRPRERLPGGPRPGHGGDHLARGGRRGAARLRRPRPGAVQGRQHELGRAGAAVGQSMKSRGFTLVEILVYTFLSAIVMVALISLFVVGRRSGAEATSSYLLGRAVDEAVRVLREDLQGAPLSSVRVDRSPP